MKLIHGWVVSAVVLTLAGFAPPVRAGGGDPDVDHDFIIGQDGTAAHMIVLQDDEGYHHLDGQPIVLTPGEGLNDGYYVHQFPGWDATAGEPNPLLEGHQLTLLRISATNPGFDMFDPFNGVPILESDGSGFEFPWGGELEHEDVFYRVDSALANPGDTFTVDMQLTDPSGLHASSAPFTLNFEVAPEPASLSLLALAGLALRRRLSAR